MTRNVARLAPPVPKKSPPTLTATQARTYLALRRGHPDYLRRLIAFHLGARQGEVLGITLDNLHLNAPVPSVELAWEVRRVIWAHGCGPTDADRQRPCGRRRGADRPDRLEAARPRRFLFEASPGVPVGPRDDHAQWVQGLADAGLPRVRLHSARSTAATLLLERDAPQRLIMEILGHTQVATTAHYQQPSLDYQARTLTGVATAFAGENSSTSRA